MNQNIRSLSAIAEKKQRRIIGLMSGTSLDGLDIAVCMVEGTGFQTKIIVEHFETVLYEPEFRRLLRENCFAENISLQQLSLLNKTIAETHAKLINAFSEKRNIDKAGIDLIASHGQTVYHDPHSHTTLQIGDGDHIAVRTGIITISDFRQKNIVGGGEGAPLAAYGDLLLFGEKDNNILLLNIGGIANFSFLPAEGKMISSDIGPGNTLMNVCMNINFPEKDHDEDAAFASKGKINEALLLSLKTHSFFGAPFPKTTGPELFNVSFLKAALKNSGTENIPAEDIMATLNKFTADNIIDAITKITTGKKYKIYVSGGGTHNPLLIQHLKQGLPAAASFHNTAEKNIPADAKEAVLFALLANECVAGEPQVFSGIAENMPAVCMGKISFPY